MILPNHKYSFVEEYDINSLSDFADHKRLRLYYFKGRECAVCGIKGERLILGEGRNSKHVDLYDKDLTVMMTVGHIIPKSKGGPNTLDNFRPLCHICNSKEGNSLVHLCEDPILFDKYLKGKTVRKINKKPFADGEHNKKIESVFWHEKEGWKFSFTNKGGTYKINKVFFIKQKHVTFN